jgi:hypothetical protein
MQKKHPTGPVKARVLADGSYGKINDVVQVSEGEAAASTELDCHPDAVAYAESLAPAPEAGEQA